jgi:hypothetical protein
MSRRSARSGAIAPRWWHGNRRFASFDSLRSSRERIRGRDGIRHCRTGLEQYCDNGMVMTYGSTDEYRGGPTLGGDAQSIVVTEDFVLRMAPQTNSPSGAGELRVDAATAAPGTVMAVLHVLPPGATP